MSSIEEVDDVDEVDDERTERMMMISCRQSKTKVLLDIWTAKYVLGCQTWQAYDRGLLRRYDEDKIMDSRYGREVSWSGSDRMLKGECTLLRGGLVR